MTACRGSAQRWPAAVAAPDRVAPVAASGSWVGSGSSGTASGAAPETRAESASGVGPNMDVAIQGSMGAVSPDRGGVRG